MLCFFENGSRGNAGVSSHIPADLCLTLPSWGQWHALAEHHQCCLHNLLLGCHEKWRLHLVNGWSEGLLSDNWALVEDLQNASNCSHKVTRDVSSSKEGRQHLAVEGLTSRSSTTPLLRGQNWKRCAAVATCSPALMTYYDLTHNLLFMISGHVPLAIAA